MGSGDGTLAEPGWDYGSAGTLRPIWDGSAWASCPTGQRRRGREEGVEVAAGDVAGPDFFEVGFGVAFDGFAVCSVTLKADLSPGGGDAKLLA